MAVLSSAEYEILGSDPSRIVTLFQQHKAAVADIPWAMNEAMEAAAFCTLVSYQSAGYGAAFPRGDLASLLEEELLSCSQYVHLAARLFEEFQFASATYEIVGWDGGAVGNHAQWIVHSDGQHGLFDPTVGLVAPNTTLEGLIAGNSYQVFSKFAPAATGADLSAFSALVAEAIFEGRYKIWDGIYRFDSADEAFTDAYLDGMQVGRYRSGWIGDDDFTWSGIAYGGKGHDRISGGPGSDVLYGSVGNDVLIGRKGSDMLDGGTGRDRMVGGAGRDELYAGEDNSKDVFVFAEGGSGRTKETRDRIYDFDAKGKDEKVWDRIDFKELGVEWSDVGIDNAGKHVLVEVDYKGDAKSDLMLAVMDIANLHRGDFIL